MRTNANFAFRQEELAKLSKPGSGRYSREQGKLWICGQVPPVSLVAPLLAQPVQHKCLLKEQTHQSTPLSGGLGSRSKFTNANNLKRSISLLLWCTFVNKDLLFPKKNAGPVRNFPPSDPTPAPWL